MDEGKKGLIKFGAASFVGFNIILVATSCMWLAGPIINGCLILLSILSLIAGTIAKRNSKTRFSQFLLISFFMFWFSFGSQYLIKRQIVHSTEKKAESLISQLELYKLENGRYPAHLNSNEFTSLHISHILNFEISYKYLDDSTYVIKFPTFNQAFRYRDGNGEWYNHDK